MCLNATVKMKSNETFQMCMLACMRASELKFTHTHTPVGFIAIEFLHEIIHHQMSMDIKWMRALLVCQLIHLIWKSVSVRKWVNSFYFQNTITKVSPNKETLLKEIDSVLLSSHPLLLLYKCVSEVRKLLSSTEPIVFGEKNDSHAHRNFEYNFWAINFHNPYIIDDWDAMLTHSVVLCIALDL